MNKDLQEALELVKLHQTCGQLEWERETLLTMVQSRLKPRFSIELGSAAGGMAYLIAAVTQTKVIAVDIRHTTHRSVMVPKIEWITGYTNSIGVLGMAKKRIGGWADFLFIDAEHTKKAAQNDFNIWKTMIRPGGWIAFHDINNASCPGVREVWDGIVGHKIELIQTSAHNHFGYEGYIGCGGIGVVTMP